MSFNNPLPHENNYTFSRGKAYLSLFDSDGVPLGERYLGNAPGCSISVATTKYEHYSSATKQSLKDASIITGVSFNGKIEIEDLSTENLQLILSGSNKTITQAAVAVTGERIQKMQALREYQLGTTSSNPTGVRGVGTVTVALWEATNAAARANTTFYTVGSVFKSGSNAFVVTAEGTTAGAAPAFATAAIGDSTTDGTATVKWVGSTTAYTVNTDYTLSTEAGRIATPAGGKPALAAAVMPAGFYLSFLVGYTPVVNSRSQIGSTSDGSVKGVFRFIADNAVGDNYDLYISSCTVSVSGELPFVGGNSFSKVTFDLGVNEKDSSIPQVIIDGRAA